MTDLGTPRWEEALWSEFEEHDRVAQIALAGEWITRVTQVLLPQLGDRRRIEILNALSEPGMDATRLAEELGTRRTAIVRLAEEGRATLKRRRELDEGGEVVPDELPMTP